MTLEIYGELFGSVCIVCVCMCIYMCVDMHSGGKHNNSEPWILK